MPTTPFAPRQATTEPRSSTDLGGPLPVEITPEAAAILLRVARAAVVTVVSGGTRPSDLATLLPRDPPAELIAPAAAFVTLHAGGELRGCIGSIRSDRPLWRTVVSAAIGAAADDPRFAPVSAREVPTLSIDVSVLGPPLPLRDLAAFRPGIDGLIVERIPRVGLLLPEVATEQGWGVDQMLEATCWKAGLPGDAWQDPGTRVFAFRTAHISERDRG